MSNAPPRVAVLDYGSGNIRSVSRAAEKAGGRIDIATGAGDFDPDGYDGLVLPGQGHFGHCVDELRAVGLDRVVTEWCQRGRPFLGICVGMQILVEGSDEGGSIGLGILPGRCKLVGGEGLTVPHMGWDQQTWPSGSRVFAGADPATRYYYCHSYAVASGTGTLETTAEYGPTFVAALERDYLWAVQFHPEKSSKDGLAIWRNYLDACRRWRADGGTVDVSTGSANTAPEG